jgi:PhoH-like ATPase
MKKTFVIDTNVLLHNCDSIEAFKDNIVVIPMAVIEELDRFKKESNELGRNARHVIRRIDDLRSAGNLRDGVPLANGGELRILTTPRVIDRKDLDIELPDNRILLMAYALHEAGENVIFVTKDINARLKADALGLKAEDFENQKINFDDLYAGYSEMTVAPEVIKEFHASRFFEVNAGRYPNEFLILRSVENGKQTALGRVVRPGLIKHLSKNFDTVWNIQARNKEQRMALELLMDPEVQIVTLVGQAGTGKTLLALAAALHTTLRHHRYDRILVSRPVIPMGKDIGYLPGAKEEKLSHWMQPIFDNLTYLVRDEPTQRKRKTKTKSKLTPRHRVEQLMSDNIVALEALTYIRGRSIPRQYVIVDEAQNLTPHEVKTIVSRAGEDTKMVLTGDPYQIDNPYLDAASNGLTFAAERLKNHSVHGQILLRKSERSELAGIAAEYL